MAEFFSRFPRAASDGALDVTDVRQGRWGRHVFWVLVASTTLAFIGLFGSWAYHATGLSIVDEKTRPTAQDARDMQGIGGPVRQTPDDGHSR